MIDLKLLREDPKKYKKAAEQKKIDVDIDRLLALDEEIIEIKQELDQLREQRNQLAKQKENDPEKGRIIKEMAKAKEGELRLLEPELEKLMYLAPNIPSKHSPIGPDSDSNKEIEKYGEVPKFDFEPKDHVTLGQDLDLIDFERGVKIHGFRGYILKNQAVLLQQAILTMALEKMQKRGFTLMTPPVLVKDFALYGSGHFPFAQEEVFAIKNTDDKEQKDRLYLTGTSEPSLLAYRSNEILDEAELPLKYCAISPCFRSEVGSYGKDSKGLYRMHEFTKVEQVVICKNDNEELEKYFVELEEGAKEMLQDLELSYRVVACSTGDMGAGKYKMHDIETWMPSRNDYGETHSNSALTDWQSRRLNLKYKDKAGKKYFAYTLNNTAIASPRILIALLENHQQKDGSIKIPRALQKYCGFSEIKMKTPINKD